MNCHDSFSVTDEEIIDSATSAEEIIRALAKRGCIDLTPLIDQDACSQNACAGGGFCDVYRGEMYDGTQIAIKSLRVYDGPEADSQRRKILKHAARELYHWSKLQHPNVLSLMGLTIFRNNIAMVSEWMENGSLMSFLRINPGIDRMPFCMNICAGLRYIHNQGMIHGDLKAANVMVSSCGVAMIGDFGNAQLKDLTLKFSNTKVFSISLRWTAPELLHGEGNSQPTKETDIYAFAMTILEVLTAQVPFGTKKDSEVIYSVLLRKRPLRPEIDLKDVLQGRVLRGGWRRKTKLQEDELWELVNSCWEWSPAEQPSIEGVSDRLQALYPKYKHHAQELNSTRIPDIQDRANKLLTLGKASMLRYQELNKLKDLNQAINYHDCAVRVTPENDAEFPCRIYWLGRSYYLRFEHQGKLSDIDQATAYLRQAAQLTPDDDPDKPDGLYWLGMSCYLRFEHYRERTDIDQAITYLGQMVQLTSIDNTEKSDGLYWLGMSHYLRFECISKLTDINQAIAYLQQAVQTTPHGDAEIPGRTYWLGMSHYRRFEHQGELSDIDQAIDYLDQVVQLTPDGDAEKPGILYWLARSYYPRFERRGKAADIDQAIGYFLRVIELTPHDDADKADRLYWLGMSYFFRYERHGELADIDQAVVHLRQVAQLTPDGDQDRLGRLYWLGRSYSILFEHYNKLSDIDQAVSYIRKKGIVLSGLSGPFLTT